MTVSINGHSLGGGSWEGLTNYELRIPVPTSQLQSGDNLVEVRALGGTENMFYLDRIAVQYRRLARAVGDRLTLSAEVTGPLAVDGFSSGEIHVFDITDPKTPRHLTASDPGPRCGGPRCHLQRQAECALSGIVQRGHCRRSAGVNDRRDLQLATDPVDYLVIAPLGSRDAAQQLADYRQTKGLSSRVVGTDEIYDSFNWGIASPEALREFLRRLAGPGACATSSWLAWVALITGTSEGAASPRRPPRRRPPPTACSAATTALWISTATAHRTSRLVASLL